MLSIIIPVYNGAEWLAEAIESALNQTENIYEIIIVNDGSQDFSLEIANKYANDNAVEIYRRKCTVINQVNKGLASARNVGVMNAQGDYCLFLDADDKLLPNAVETILETIKQTNADVIAPSFLTFGNSDQEIILMKDPKLEDFRTGNRVGYCQAIRRSALLAVGGYSPKMVEGYEDLSLTINLLTRGYKLVTIPEVLWMYRTKKESMYTKAIQYHKKLLAQINKDFPTANIQF